MKFIFLPKIILLLSQILILVKACSGPEKSDSSTAAPISYEQAQATPTPLYPTTTPAPEATFDVDKAFKYLNVTVRSGNQIVPELTYFLTNLTNAQQNDIFKSFQRLDISNDDNLFPESLKEIIEGLEDTTKSNFIDQLKDILKSLDDDDDDEDKVLTEVFGYLKEKTENGKFSDHLISLGEDVLFNALRKSATEKVLTPFLKGVKEHVFKKGAVDNTQSAGDHFGVSNELNEAGAKHYQDKLDELFGVKEADDKSLSILFLRKYLESKELLPEDYATLDVTTGITNARAALGELIEGCVTNAAEFEDGTGECTFQKYRDFIDAIVALKPQG